ncbi:hypothetical protein FNH22_30705 [Fulvivirga sp. M361]|uniref:hypothetical protein n=1 Tax=Fulvivirga sp. M361 TaxID=2594266 RepID=UPI00117A7C26|nr:hypothetical protein [Fulvivirga sp. M361]TRX46481.1 hypothetical protein FNH22_30705 [Fulvivirga sp. M361]
MRWRAHRSKAVGLIIDQKTTTKGLKHQYQSVLEIIRNERSHPGDLTLLYIENSKTLQKKLHYPERTERMVHRAECKERRVWRRAYNGLAKKSG